MSNNSCYPNILILMSDEHRADLSGFGGNSIVKTPVLDCLAREGTVFDNAYTPSPICVPARQCLMSGQLPKTCGCDGSWMDLAPGYPTFSRRFSQNAYNTVCSGKLHHIGTDQMQGWTQRLAPDAKVFVKYQEGLLKEAWLAQDQPLTRGRPTNESIVRGASVEFGKHQWFDAHAVDAAQHFIQSYFSERTSRCRPLMLKVSLKQPHYPFCTDQKKFDYYYSKVPVYTEKPCQHPVLSQSQAEDPVNVTPDEIRRATATYYGMVETIDTHFGELLGTLRQCGQDLDDWIIVYLSDHGEMLGQHGIWEKTRFYDASVRVPFFIRWPGQIPAGKRVEQNVSLCDLYATLCDLSGLDAPPGLDSRTLLPLVRGDALEWSNEVVSHINRHHRDHVMIKKDHLKYQYYGEDIPEVLFDLNADPAELQNVALEPEYVDIMGRFRRRLSELGYGPHGDPNYINAGYSSGVPESDISGGTLWSADSNPWLDPMTM